ncbi:MAG: hypothetical protein JOZ43_02285, partial [Acidobacteriales bacterium]|nr:hypothetical protein [Terriglobales bacterium]
KISQFPRGTRFTLTASEPRSSDQKALEQQVISMFANKGMSLSMAH